MKTSDASMPEWVKTEWDSFFDKGYKGDVFRLYETSLFPLQRISEIVEVAGDARLILPKCVMEIGADKGGAFYHWISLIDSIEKAICIEPRGTPYSERIEKEHPEIEFLWIPDGSLEPGVLQRVSEFVDGSGIDFLFIDGDKSAFEKDFDAYWPLVNSGGIVAFHDIFDNKTPMQEAFLRKKNLGSSSKVVVDMYECDRVKSDSLNGDQSKTPQYDQWVNCWMYCSCGFGLIYK